MSLLIGLVIGLFFGALCGLAMGGFMHGAHKLTDVTSEEE